jgi:hypothetical protein
MDTLKQTSRLFVRAYQSRDSWGERAGMRVIRRFGLGKNAVIPLISQSKSNERRVLNSWSSCTYQFLGFYAFSIVFDRGGLIKGFNRANNLDFPHFMDLRRR